MKHSQMVDKLSKMLMYMLGRQPDEFGLIPDAHGYVKIKELMKALGEEPGWRHVRSGHIHEVLYSSSSPPVETNANLIRAVNRSSLLLPDVPAVLPKLLYYPVRQRAHPVVLGKGLRHVTSGMEIILTGDMVMAQRLGRRIDPFPVILTVNSDIARKNGATLKRFGKLLFLSDVLPVESLSGPPLPKSRPESKKADAPKPADAPKTPGSYAVDLMATSTATTRPKKDSRQRKNEWKRDRKRRNRKNYFP